MHNYPDGAFGQGSEDPGSPFYKHIDGDPELDLTPFEEFINELTSVCPDCEGLGLYVDSLGDTRDCEFCNGEGLIN